MNRTKTNWQSYRQPDPLPKKAATPKQQITNAFQQNFKIYLRVKPLLPNNNHGQSLCILNRKEVEIIPPYYSTESDKIYQYQEVFGQEATNEQVFIKTMLEPISNVLDGYNSTVFIYGMTGAGKTHTMFSSIQEECSLESEGIVGLTLRKLFEEINIRKNNEFQVIVSFYQIYNENIRDLLSDSCQSLTIMQDPLRGVFINELGEVQVNCAASARIAIQSGLNKRTINSTRNNQVSSRSHAILQFTIRKYQSIQNTNQVAVAQSKMYLIDLAGNEKAGHNESKRFVEGVNINKSLLTLGKCISILSEQKKHSFIPFRDSKLTRILKDSLGGNSKTVMIACVSSETRFYEQTLNTLKYSTKAKRIKNKGKSAGYKLINKKQIPNGLVNAPVLDIQFQQQKLYQFVTNLQILIQQKLRTQKMNEQLQICYAETQKQLKINKQSEIHANHLKQISVLLPKMNKKYNQICNLIQEEIKKMVAQLTQFKVTVSKHQSQPFRLKVEQQNQQITHLKGIIQHQNTKIGQLTQQINNIDHSQKSSNIKSSVLQNSLNLLPLEQKKISTPSCYSDKTNLMLIHENSSRSQAHLKNKMNINLSSCKNSSKNKENIAINLAKRTKTPQQSIKSSQFTQQSKAGIDHSKTTKPKPTIQISIQDIKLRQIQTVTHSLESQSSQQLGRQQKKQVNQTKERFIVRLKEMDQNVNEASKKQISDLLNEYNRLGYEMSKMQHSMLNKLKFMYKTKQDKNTSLSKEGHTRTLRDKSVRK